MKRTTKKLVGVRLPRPLVKQLKMYSAISGRSIQHIVTFAVREHLRRAK